MKSGTMASAKVGFIELGSMGLGMASSLLRAGFHVQAYDVSCYISPFMGLLYVCNV